MQIEINFQYDKSYQVLQISMPRCSFNHNLIFFSTQIQKSKMDMQNNFSTQKTKAFYNQAAFIEKENQLIFTIEFQQIFDQTIEDTDRKEEYGIFAQCLQFSENQIEPEKLCRYEQLKRTTIWFQDELYHVQKKKVISPKPTIEEWSQFKTLTENEVKQSFIEQMKDSTFYLKDHEYLKAKDVEINEIKDSLRNVALHLQAYQSQYNSKSESLGIGPFQMLNSSKKVLRNIYESESRHRSQLRNEKWEIQQFNEEFRVQFARNVYKQPVIKVRLSDEEKQKTNAQQDKMQEQMD